MSEKGNNVVALHSEPLEVVAIHFHGTVKVGGSKTGIKQFTSVTAGEFPGRLKFNVDLKQRVVLIGWRFDDGRWAGAVVPFEGNVECIRYEAEDDA